MTGVAKRRVATGRPSAAVTQHRRGRWMWVAEIPWLPDLLSTPSQTLTGNPIGEAFGRQISFLRAIAAGAPPGSALQLRFNAGGLADRIRCYLLGAAATPEAASLLNRVVTSTFPAEFPLEPVEPGGHGPIVRYVNSDTFRPGSVAEIRRSIDSLDPTIDAEGLDDSVVFAWTWSAQSLLGSLGLLRHEPSPTTLLVHIEPADLPASTAQWLQDEIRRLAIDLRDGEENPLALAVLRGYRRWLRLLPRDCLALRMLIASGGLLTPGLAESLSTDLTRSFEAGAEPIGAADVVWATEAFELDACSSLIDDLRTASWRAPAHRPQAELLHLFDPLEAHTAFRIPVTPRGGLDGIASQRLSSIHRGADVRELGRAITIGSLPTAGEFALSASDLNQHCLVAGLPGFGKTSTVQLLLRRAYGGLGVPFLVIDPSKTDYEPLIDQLAAEEPDRDPLIVRLTRDAPAFNPLAPPAGVDPAVHAGRVIAAFDAAFDLTAWFPLAHVQLCRAIYRLYDEISVGGPAPTLRDLYRTVGALVRRSRFGAEVRGNLEGSLLGRLEFLASGPAGRALAGGPNDAIDWASICARPTLIELGAFAGPAERSLVFALLIASLVSWREANPADGLGHLTVLEEAHRVLRPAKGSDAGVETFIEAIAELRGAGEGFVIVDQAPSLLHPGVIKLTGTKIVHRLVDAGERVAVGASMVLDAAQLDDLARLAPRRAVVYAASGSSAALVDIDDTEADKWDATRGLASRQSALCRTPVEESLFCVGCPVMCVGPADPAVVRSPDIAAAVSGPARDLLTVASQRVRPSDDGRPPGHRGYCAAATALGHHFRSDPVGLRHAIDALVTGYEVIAANYQKRASTGLRPAP